MQEIADKFQQSKITVEEWKHHNAWLHREEVLHAESHTAFLDRVDDEFAKRFSGKEHDGLSVVPSYLMADAENSDAGRVAGEILTVSNATESEHHDLLNQDAKAFVDAYYKDAQFVFSRVQHHCHQKTAKGYVPFKACKVKQRGKGKKWNCLICKAGFPKNKLIVSSNQVLCRALAKKHGLRCSGRRNQLGSMLGKRSCEWQSGTLPVFAVLFRSNSHTLPNCRAPLLDITHEDSLCKNKACKETLRLPSMLKSLAKLAQRVCRECTGYHSGYTFKKQPIPPVVEVVPFFLGACVPVVLSILGSRPGRRASGVKQLYLFIFAVTAQTPTGIHAFSDTSGSQEIGRAHV